MNRAPEGEKSADAPAADGDGGNGSGEGADTALQAMLRKRRAHLNDPVADGLLPPDGFEPGSAPKP
jgi:hypothetical protein